MTNTTLAQLRSKIDTLDASVHELLMERGKLIEELIAAKQGIETGSAFRPAREAAMIRALIARHSGCLPVETVVQVWRDIISTFTYLQMPYHLHIEKTRSLQKGAHGRDLVRGMFGFVVPIIEQPSTTALIKALKEHPKDLAIITQHKYPWWKKLENPNAPKIVAALPDLTQSLKSACIAGLIIGSPDIPTDGLPKRLWSVSLNTPLNHQQTLMAHAERSGKTHALMVFPTALSKQDVQQKLEKEYRSVHSLIPVGLMDDDYWKITHER